MNRDPVLIFSSDPLAAALLAAAIELAGHAPHFAAKGEAAREALRRVKPRLILIDCDHEEGCSDEFIGPALMMKAGVLLFRSSRTAFDRSEFAGRLKIRVIEMPIEFDELQGILQGMLTS